MHKLLNLVAHPLLFGALLVTSCTQSDAAGFETSPSGGLDVLIRPSDLTTNWQEGVLVWVGDPWRLSLASDELRRLERSVTLVDLLSGESLPLAIAEHRPADHTLVFAPSTELSSDRWYVVQVDRSSLGDYFRVASEPAEGLILRRRFFTGSRPLWHAQAILEGRSTRVIVSFSEPTAYSGDPVRDGIVRVSFGRTECVRDDARTGQLLDGHLDFVCSTDGRERISVHVAPGISSPEGIPVRSLANRTDDVQSWIPQTDGFSPSLDLAAALQAPGATADVTP